jgi:hypothetical protein
MLGADSPDQAMVVPCPSETFTIRRVMGLCGPRQTCGQFVNHCYFFDFQMLRDLRRAAFSAFA